MLKFEPPIMVVAKALSKRVATQVGDLTILSEVSLEIKSGESVAVVGVSGSGKSTLLGLLAGLDEATSGKVILAGQDLSQLDEDGRAVLRGKYVGFVFQSFQLLPTLTALENVMLPLEILGVGGAEKKALSLLGRVGLIERVDHYPKQLSGGEQQRVAIARAFVTQPAILFADEPTGNLDVATGEKIIDLLFELNRESSTTLIMVTHDEHLASRCDRKISLEAGNVVNLN
ncbi:MAG: ABC transporter ATP-binding protein [Pseudomonadales bacterium]|nr:ABC transporter ATP-binding protein [Pseudomonadales bacterium]